MRNRKIAAYAMVAAIVAIAVVAITEVTQNGPDDTSGGSDVSTPTVIITHSYFDLATGERSAVTANLAGARVPGYRRISTTTCTTPVATTTRSPSWLSMGPHKTSSRPKTSTVTGRRRSTTRRSSSRAVPRARSRSAT